jgi:hypothetical protein
VYRLETEKASLILENIIKNEINLRYVPNFCFFTSSVTYFVCINNIRILFPGMPKMIASSEERMDLQGANEAVLIDF